MPHLKCNVGEYGVIVNAEGKFLILRLPLNDEFPTEMWMLPGGRLESDDQPEEGLRREVGEETGLEIEIVAPVHTARWGIEDPMKYTVFYLCRVVDKSPERISSEHADSRWIGFDEIDSLPWLNAHHRTAAEKASYREREKMYVPEKWPSTFFKDAPRQHADEEARDIVELRGNG